MPARPKPSLDQVKELVHYDPLTGVFTWRKSPHYWVKEGSRADSTYDTAGYRKVNLLGGNHAAHRLAWFYCTGEWPKTGLDHKNTVRDDNRLDNLRLATPSQNSQNRKGVERGLKGTTWHNGSWRAQIMFQRSNYHLGSYLTQEEAHEAYKIGAAYFHGEFANTQSLTGPILAPDTEVQTSFERTLREVTERRKQRVRLAKSVKLPPELRAALLAMHEYFSPPAATRKHVRKTSRRLKKTTP